MSMRRALFSSNGKLPHTELSYLSSNGTQYINTGISGQSGLKITCEVMQTAQTQKYFFGSRIAFNNNQLAFGVGGSLTQFLGCYGSQSKDFNTRVINQKYTVILDDETVYIDGVNQGTFTNGIFDNARAMYLFGLNNNGVVFSGYSMTGRIYSFKIENVNGILLDFIPVLRNDGVYCMYDKVSKTYFTNSGTGVFSGGM